MSATRSDSLSEGVAFPPNAFAHIRHIITPTMAEGVGIEPTQPFLVDALAVRCITILPTFHHIKLSRI